MIQTKRGLTLEVYSSGMTTIQDPRGELRWAEDLEFSTGYPGGDLEASFTVPRKVIAWWEINGAKRVIFRQGQKMIYEGYVGALDRLLDEQGQSIKVPCMGGWAHILMNRRWRKYWADNRIDESIWQYITDLTSHPGAEKMTIDRNKRIRFTPKNVAFSSSPAEAAGVRYTMPTGETIKRVTWSYDLQEGAQAWEIRLRDRTNSVTYGSITSSGTGTQDATISPAVQYLDFEFIPRANQTPASDGSIYGEFSNIIVYSETGAIDPTEVTKDIIGHFSDLNTDTGKVNSNTLSIVPFLAEWDELAADIVTRALSFGDASNNRWAAFLLNSENAQTPDGKPILGIQMYPVLTDYDLFLRLDETNISGQVQISQVFENIPNWIVVEYQDENGWTKWITPEDDATLKDTTSIDNYDQCDHLLKLDYSTSTVATANAKRFLAAYKDPQWNSSPINVIDYINKKKGNPIPTAQIRAGQRLKIENFIQDLSGTGLTMLITSTHYEDETGICGLTFGKPELPLLIMLNKK